MSISPEELAALTAHIRAQILADMAHNPALPPAPAAPTSEIQVVMNVLEESRPIGTTIFRGPVRGVLLNGAASVTTSQSLKNTLETIINEYRTTLPALLARAAQEGTIPDTTDSVLKQCTLAHATDLRMRLTRPILFAAVERWRIQHGMAKQTCSGTELDALLRQIHREDHIPEARKKGSPHKRQRSPRPRQ